MDIFIFSCVRSNEGGNIGFLNNFRRRNVSIIRAKHSLILIGDSATFCEARKSIWKKFIDYCENSGRDVEQNEKVKFLGISTQYLYLKDMEISRPNLYGGLSFRIDMEQPEDTSGDQDHPGYDFIVEKLLCGIGKADMHLHNCTRQT